MKTTLVNLLYHIADVLPRNVACLCVSPIISIIIYNNLYIILMLHLINKSLHHYQHPCHLSFPHFFHFLKETRVSNVLTEVFCSCITVDMYITHLHLKSSDSTSVALKTLYSLFSPLNLNGCIYLCMITLYVKP